MKRLIAGSSFARWQQGAELIEFALVLPAFLILIFGILFYSIVFFTDQTLSHAAQRAADAVLAVDPDAPNFADKAVQQAQGQLDRSLSLFPGSSPSLSSGTLDEDNRCIAASTGNVGAVCVESATNGEGQRAVVVQLSAGFSVLWPGFPRIALVVVPDTLSATGTAYVASAGANTGITGNQ